MTSEIRREEFAAIPLADCSAMPNTRLLDILDFWHKLEFFIPYDLDSRSEPEDRRKSFWRNYGDTSQIPFETPPSGMKITGYTVLLGVFDKADIRDVLDGLRPDTESEALEEEMRADLEGRTCMASIDLDLEGTPMFQTFSISTLPWAIGRVRHGGLHGLSAAAFQQARLKLQDLLKNFAAKRPAGSQHDQAEDGPDCLLPWEVDNLVDLLASWSDFRPDENHPAALLEVRFGKKRPPRPDTAPADTTGEEDEETDDVQEIGILNSFYISDLERAMSAVSRSEVPATLQQYLSPLAHENRQDLFTAQGRETLIDILAPARMNRGRWFNNPDHAMSQMQQFAINAAASRLGDAGLYSVNGPPGTGKTTLLRDIVAENITSRARVLANLPKATNAFTRIKNSNLVQLIPELTGFEMVVASSNNTAVENISNDLPKGGSVWSGEPISYLRPIAHKLAAQGADGKCARLPEKDMPWGLIAAALGKSANRYRVSSRLFGMKIAPDGPVSWAGDQPPQTFWQWRDERQNSPELFPSFKEAQVAFLEADGKVAQLLDELQAYEHLRRRMHGQSEEGWTVEAKSTETRARNALEAAESALRNAQAEQQVVGAQLEASREEERLLSKLRPSWWQRLLGSPEARRHALRIRQNTEAQIALLQSVRDLTDRRSRVLEPAVEASAAQHAKAVDDLVVATEEWRSNWAKLTELKLRFGDICPPDDSSELESDQLQIAGLWHRREYAALRSDLFRKALALHETWLATVCASKVGFAPNIFAVSQMLRNQPCEDGVSPLVIWQSLFMVVPVISSTFASFARQFADLGTSSIGWLFIDEAGQAVPQAAVGALTRARRAVVIGDPLQIEPIFTLPRQLIEGLAGQSPVTADGSWSPDRVSVQTLADACNPFGAEVPGQGDEPIWIGSPLRVHRRCLDPMFSTANEIAYDGKMVFGMKDRLPAGEAAPFHGPSCWVDLPGRVAGKQAVPVQIEFVARLIGEAFRQTEKLPALYVISPFREVKQRLVNRLSESSFWGDLDCPRPAKQLLRDWVSQRIGTVHTFQGKEQETVIMLLGADQGTANAAQWAASKPNLLNVALTRAQTRFYMVGDHALWGQLPYFREAAARLPSISPEAFLARVEAGRQAL